MSNTIVVIDEPSIEENQNYLSHSDSEPHRTQAPRHRVHFESTNIYVWHWLLDNKIEWRHLSDECLRRAASNAMTNWHFLHLKWWLKSVSVDDYSSFMTWKRRFHISVSVYGIALKQSEYWCVGCLNKCKVDCSTDRYAFRQFKF